MARLGETPSVNSVAWFMNSSEIQARIATAFRLGENLLGAATTRAERKIETETAVEKDTFILLSLYLHN